MSVISKLLMNQTSSLRRTEMDYYNIRDVAQDSHKGYKDLIAMPTQSLVQTRLSLWPLTNCEKDNKKLRPWFMMPNISNTEKGDENNNSNKMF